MLYNLTYISFDMYEAWFDEFVTFMSKLIAPVHVLRIKYHTSSDYLDADDWEQLIKNVYLICVHSTTNIMTSI